MRLRMRHNQAVLPIALIGAGAGAAIGFTLLARSVKRHGTRHVDGTVRRALPKRHRRVTRVAMQLIEPLGKWYGQMPIAALATAAVWRARGPRAGLPIAAASASAASLAWVLERTMRPRKPPPGRHSPTEPAFPSGHSLQTAAVAWTSAYVLVRDGIASPGGAVPLAVALPALSGLVKLWRDRHWFTDVVGGYLLGAALAASAAAGHEIARPRRRRRIRRTLAILAR
jgi:undecaprenyl-diphosphatase